MVLLQASSSILKHFQLEGCAEPLSSDFDLRLTVVTIRFLILSSLISSRLSSWILDNFKMAIKMSCYACCWSQYFRRVSWSINYHAKIQHGIQSLKQILKIIIYYQIQPNFLYTIICRHRLTSVESLTKGFLSLGPFFVRNSLMASGVDFASRHFR